MTHSPINHLGTSFGFHDAALALVTGDRIIHASHSERYSRVKGDRLLHPGQLAEIDGIDYSDITYYEKVWKKTLRQRFHGQERADPTVREHIRSSFGTSEFRTVGHHHSHAAAGFYTSPFDEAAIIVVDAVGEWDTLSVWVGKDDYLTKINSISYPHSLGLLYTAFTQRCGLKPNEEEYILMGMAGFGSPCYVEQIRRDFFSIYGWEFRLKENVHRGIGNWMPHAAPEDLAASIQHVTEQYLIHLFKEVRLYTGKKNVVFQGGVALNCAANARLLKEGIFDGYWIMPNPGDAGASLGAVLAAHGRRVEWAGPYLGTHVDPVGTPRDVVDELLTVGVCGLAQGRAEFGPRALGNRSLLADPRVPSMKNRVNTIKKRDMFRPFAPAVLAERAGDWFETYGADCRYMQYALPCKRPSEIPAVVHADGTSRVQTVSQDDNRFFHEVLNLWYQETGCPVLLNTSLNIKGEPLVNTRQDANRFAELHNVKVY